MEVRHRRRPAVPVRGGRTGPLVRLVNSRVSATIVKGGFSPCLTRHSLKADWAECLAGQRATAGANRPSHVQSSQSPFVGALRAFREICGP